MELGANVKQISTDEKRLINQQVYTDLIEHLYAGCLPGTICGIVASIAIFLDFYNYTPFYPLIAWLIGFNIMMVALSILYFIYMEYKDRLTTLFWGNAYSIMMIGCSISWVPIVYLLPEDLTRQYLGLVAFFLATTGYATGTIGQFRLCVITLNIMLVPLIVWCLLRGGIFYNIIAIYSVIYMAFMLGTNLRSTRWFKESLKLKLENTLVSYQANHDLLTDLPNQRLLPQYIDSAISYANNIDSPFSLLCFSLNRIDVINDSLGHQAGDMIIQSVANRLETFAAELTKANPDRRCIVTISRKDTFNVILVPMEDDEVNDVIRNLFAILDEPFTFENQRIKITASVGMSFYPKDGHYPQTLLMNADSAMLQAKRFGGNRVEFYRSEINAQIPKQLELETDLHAALKNNQLQVFFQPLVNLKTDQITGMEALIRWPHPVHGYISPLNFIPIAEETGLIIPIGAWVLREACLQTKMWHQMGFTDLKVAVNLSEKQIRDNSIVGTIRHILKTTQFDPHYLELELTETAILDESIIAVIKEFKEMGLSLAVDDFGTGYSGLSYLKRFSIDKIKIDQSFIRDIPANSESMTIVSAIIVMAKELNIITLAEGIETKEQLNFLKNRGCDYGQGYFFSKPVDAQSLTKVLLNNREALRRTTEAQETMT